MGDGLEESEGVYTGKLSKWLAIEGNHFARGGNAEIYCVVNEGDRSTTRALKLFARDIDSPSRVRFQSEIDIVEATNDIQGCMSLIDHGYHNGRPFYVMPFYKNGTIDIKYRDRDRDTDCIELILGDFLSVASTVSDLHSRRLAVRDIKPKNILIDDDGIPVLADFGLSLWSTAEESERLTISNEAVGSQGYRPPEWANRYPDPDHTPGDIWSLGRTLWALLADSHAPANFETLGGEGDHLNRFIQRDLANVIQGILTSCTAQNPRDRPSVLELKDLITKAQEQIVLLKAPLVETELDEVIKSLSAQIPYSAIVLNQDLQRSEAHIKVAQVDAASDVVLEHLRACASRLNESEFSRLGRFRTIARGHGHRTWRRRQHKKRVFSKNDRWHRGGILRFDPSKELQVMKRINYSVFEVSVGILESGPYYCAAYYRDQTGPTETFIDFVETKSIVTTITSKLPQLDQFIANHFISGIAKYL